MTSLTPHQTEQLVSLRLALEKALIDAKGAGKYRRGSSIVALDAAVERASWLTIVARGHEVPKRGGLDALISTLKEKLGSRWTPTVLPDIRHLHRARNATQHEGLEPDREQLPVWAAATEAYVTSLIMAQFDIDIRRIVLSDAVRDFELQRHLRNAEIARDSQDYQACVEHAKQAYQEAMDRWKRLKGSSGLSTLRRREAMDRKGHDYLIQQIQGLHAILDSAVFAVDTAEIEWFRAAIAEPGEVLNSEDADRVLAFAFQWVVEYEHAAASWGPNRRHRTDLDSRLVRSADVPARIEECISLDFVNDEVRVDLRLADVPEESEYGMWAETLRETFSSIRPPSIQHWGVTGAATIVLYKDAEQPLDFTVEIDALASALVETHKNMKNQQEMLLQEAQARRARQAKLVEEVEAVREEMPAWVQDVELSNDAPGGREQIVLTISEDVSSLQSDNNVGLGQLISNHELVSQCYPLRDPRQRGLTPVLTVEQLVRVLNEVDPQVQSRMEASRREAERQATAIQTAKSTIAAKIVSLSSIEP